LRISPGRVYCLVTCRCHGYELGKRRPLLRHPASPGQPVPQPHNAPIRPLPYETAGPAHPTFEGPP
jgi:hypothetical protein